MATIETTELGGTPGGRSTSEILIIFTILIILVFILIYYYTLNTNNIVNSEANIINDITPKISNNNTYIKSTGNNFNKINKIIFKDYTNKEISTEFTIINNTTLFLKTPADSGIYSVYYMFKDNTISNTINIEVVKL